MPSSNAEKRPKVPVERNGRSTRLVDNIRQSEMFLEMLKKTQNEDLAIAYTAVMTTSVVGNMVKFYSQYKTFLKNRSDSPEARKNPEKAAKEKMMEALKDYGDLHTDRVWESVIDGSVDKSELGMEIPTRSTIIEIYKGMKRGPKPTEYIN
jgi:hypothetical protein